MSRSDSEFLAQYGPWALVAGASEGLGAEFAAELAGRGLNLLLVARRRPELEELSEILANEWGVEVRPLVLDLAGADAAEEIRQETADLDIGLLVYNAAYSIIGPFLDQSSDDHLKELNVNCRTPLAITHHLAKRMVDRGKGGIVLLSSMAAFQGSPLIAHYAATKAYTAIFAEGLWAELRESGVDVLACCPGATRTPNYLRSKPASTGSALVPVMEAEAVVREALAQLGRRPSMIPGPRNRIAAFLLHRLLPRRRAIAIMGDNMRSMYKK